MATARGRAVDTLDREPQTVVGRQRRGFQMLWTWKSHRRAGRPTVPPDIRVLIRTSQRNPRCGAPRIHGELLKVDRQVDVQCLDWPERVSRRRVVQAFVFVSPLAFTTGIGNTVATAACTCGDRRSHRPSEGNTVARISR